MAWIESHQELADHPKTWRFAELLGIGTPQAIGHLHLLWYWAMDYAGDGDLTTFTPGQIARATRWEGDAGALVDALIEAGFMDSDHLIHDWADYAGRLLRARAANKDRMREKRAAHVQRTTETRAAHVQGLPYPTQPNTTIQDQSPLSPSGDISPEGETAPEPKTTKYRNVSQKTKGPKATEPPTITQDFRDELIEKFSPLPWTAAEVNERINYLLSHEAAKKYHPPNFYLSRRLREDAEITKARLAEQEQRNARQQHQPDPTRLYQDREPVPLSQRRPRSGWIDDGSDPDDTS